MSSQENIKGHVFQKQAWRPLILKFYFYVLSQDDSVCKKLEKFNHYFSYTFTSFRAIRKFPENWYHWTHLNHHKTNFLYRCI